MNSFPYSVKLDLGEADVYNDITYTLPTTLQINYVFPT